MAGLLHAFVKDGEPEQASGHTRKTVTMKSIFGPNTQRILGLIGNLHELSGEQIDLVASTWKEANDLDRAAAWARLLRLSEENERYAVLAAAQAARHAAMEVAGGMRKTDWSFWAAASDAAAAMTADDLAASDYETLTGPLAVAVPPLARGGADRSYAVPAQARRTTSQRQAQRGEAKRSAGQRQAQHAHRT
jgi:hypothetical protein